MKIRWSIIGYIIKIHAITLVVFGVIAFIYILLGNDKPKLDLTKFYLWFIAWIGLVIYLVNSKIAMEKEEQYRKELEKED